MINEELNEILHKAKFWCCGHIHSQDEYKCHGTTIYFNSVGYIDENLTPKNRIIYFS